MNGEYIMAKKNEELLPLVRKQAADIQTIASASDGMLLKVINLYRVRMKTLSEFAPMTDHFFSDSFTVEEKGADKYLKTPESKVILRDFSAKLETINSFSHNAIEEACRGLADEKKLKAGQIIHPTRVAISGKTTGAGLFEMMEVLGKEKVLERMRKASQ